MQPEGPVLRVLERLRDDGSIVLAVQGDVDLGTVDILEAHLADVCDRAPAVTVDVRRVGFLDCFGLRALLELNAKGLTTDCRVTFIQGPRPVARLFELTGTLGLLTFSEAGARSRTAARSA